MSFATSILFGFKVVMIGMLLPQTTIIFLLLNFKLFCATTELRISTHYNSYGFKRICVEV